MASAGFHVCRRAGVSAGEPRCGLHLRQWGHPDGAGHREGPPGLQCPSSGGQAVLDSSSGASDAESGDDMADSLDNEEEGPVTFRPSTRGVRPCTATPLRNSLHMTRLQDASACLGKGDACYCL